MAGYDAVDDTGRSVSGSALTAVGLLIHLPALGSGTHELHRGTHRSVRTVSDVC